MKKILGAIGLLLLCVGIIGFIYLAKIDGAEPELSWGLGMGPLLIGLMLLLASSQRKEDSNANSLP
ncbi:MAG: hypothetical protein PHF50_02405 [Patescibacteria group bacterium]|nr:hypothetical protein [Patescibacteria group bacterium]